jgi:hypothetical protein
MEFTHRFISNFKAQILKTYLDAIAQSGAKMVYFSDANTHNFDQVTFDGFKKQFSKSFDMDMCNLS